jgi:hypothetical protein
MTWSLWRFLHKRTGRRRSAAAADEHQTDPLKRTVLGTAWVLGNYSSKRTVVGDHPVPTWRVADGFVCPFRLSTRLSNLAWLKASKHLNHMKDVPEVSAVDSVRGAAGEQMFANQREEKNARGRVFMFCT